MKKTSKIISLLIAGAIIFLCQACIIDGGNELPPTYYLTEATKKYVVFKKDSQWIYQQEGQNKVDTHKVMRDDINIVSGGRVVNNSSQVHQREVYSSFYKDTYTASASSSLATFSFYSEVFRSNYFGTKFLFFNGQIQGESVEVGYVYTPSSNGSTKYVAYHPSYEVAGKTYQEVMVFECTIVAENASDIDVRIPKKAYFAKNIGIIRRELSNGQVWNLISYEVKQ